MAFPEDEALLTEYTQWVASKKVAGVDTTPAAFLIERAQESAFQRVLDATAYLQRVESETDEAATIVSELLEILEK
jgi:hypothetical protein